MNFIVSSLIWSITSSTLIAMPQWKSSDTCHGEPSSIYVFSVSDLSQPVPATNESWPPFFEFGTRFYYLGDGYCGVMKTPTFTQCCLSSIDANLSGGILSSNPYVLGDVFFEEALPKSVNGKSYCNIVLSTSDGYSNYYEFSILSNNQCIDDYYRCSPDNILQIYSESDCNGDFETYQLTDTDTVFENTPIDSFTAKMTRYKKGQNEIIWITDIPGYAVVPNTTKLGDILTHVWVGIYFVTVCSMLIYSTRMAIKLKTRFWIWMIVVQLIRIATQISRTYYSYTVFEEYISAAIFGESMFVLIGVEQLLSVYLTTFQIFDFKINFIPRNYTLQVFVYAAILVVHMILFGSNYFMICTIFSRNTVFCPSFSTLTDWRAYNTFWGVFVLIWDLVPVTMIVLVLVQPDLSHMHLSLIVLKRMFTVDKRFTNLYLLQVLLTIGFAIMSYLLLDTIIFGGDRMSFCIRHFTILLFGLHTVFTALLLQRIPIIFKLVSTKNELIVPASIVSEHEKPKSTLVTKS